MSVRLASIILVLSCGLATAQPAKPADDIQAPTGRSAPEDKGQLQPQGWIGPVNTGSGGAPPESPHGQSPPRMQSAPDGSTKTTVMPPK